MEFEALKSVIETGGDVGIYLIAWITWRFDRRLIRLETTIGRRKEDVQVFD